MGPRVVSLLPSATEIVAALGHGAMLTGRSHDCDFPPEVTELPVVSHPRRKPPDSSADVHRGVVELLEQVLSIYEVDTDALRSASPDLVITQDLCRVCAVAEDEVAEAARTWLGGDVNVVTSSPMSLDEVFDDAVRIAEALGDRPAGEQLAQRLRGELANVAASVEGRERPRLALLEWADPLFTGGHWSDELVASGGCQPVLTAPAGPSPMVTAAQLRDAEPDVILVAPCGYDLPRAVEERDVLSAIPGWEELPAVRDGRLAFVDGSAFFNRPGPRLVTSAAIVAAVTHGVGPAVPLAGEAWQWW